MCSSLACLSFMSSFLDKLVRLAGNLHGASVLEVGPGPGAITRSILREGPRHATVVEKDRRFLPSLEVGLVGHTPIGRDHWSQYV